MLFVVPVLTLIVVFTQDYHSLYYLNPRIVQGPFFPYLTYEHGIWWYVHLAYVLLSSSAGAVMLIIHTMRSTGRKRKQSLIIFVANVFPVVTAVLYVAGTIPENIYPGPVSLLITGVLLWFALFRLGLFELVPEAREQALDAISEAFLVVDRAGRLQDYNKAAALIPGVRKLDIGSLPGESLLSGQLKPLLEGSRNVVEFNAGDRVYSARSYPIRTDDAVVEGTAFLIHDVTENVQLVDQLHQQANTDSLTGLFNRRHFTDLGRRLLKRCQRRETQAGVIVCDIDHFKRINDTWGHAAGDEVLLAVAAALQRGLRDSDVLGRYGGEEFAIILPGAGIERTTVIAERLRRDVEAMPIEISGEKTGITLSFGVHASAVGESTSLDDLLNLADAALYQAKNTGRNRVVAST